MRSTNRQAEIGDHLWRVTFLNNELRCLQRGDAVRQIGCARLQ
jgi:hypothetical protein